MSNNKTFLAYLVLLCLIVVRGSALAESSSADFIALAKLLAAPAAGALTSDTLQSYLADVVTIVNYSRNRCTPVFKATANSRLPVSASMIGVVYDAPCDTPKRLFFLNLTVPATPADYAAMTTVMGDAVGEPCGSEIVDGGEVRGWRTPQIAWAFRLEPDKTQLRVIMINSAAVSQAGAGSSYGRDLADFEGLMPAGCSKADMAR